VNDWINKMTFISFDNSTYGQLLLQQINLWGYLGETKVENFIYIASITLIRGSLVVFWVLLSLTWMAALTKFPLSFAYPFMSLAFVLVTVLSSVCFYEAITTPKAVWINCCWHNYWSKKKSVAPVTNSLIA